MTDVYTVERKHSRLPPHSRLHRYPYISTPCPEDELLVSAVNSVHISSRHRKFGVARSETSSRVQAPSASGLEHPDTDRTML